ncbi:hypothetical protein HPB50_004961 [Hyalomma asiaticum]|uniref:Uncharacterized protein n=1 Tax=Hyalomma asiaticum TaxID=266040 RepID=A0ACB7RT96_HYAAI|nr:hypothetical protein HPB50_004961 [Hyalomma asiaticum]
MKTALAMDAVAKDAGEIACVTSQPSVELEVNKIEAKGGTRNHCGNSNSPLQRQSSQVQHFLCEKKLGAWYAEGD